MIPHIHPTKYWHPVEANQVQCDLCPRACKLREGQRGLCFVRENQHGKIILTSWGRSSGFCIDPIEKKPLHHFLPGTPVLSFGTAGCNLACKFCQNWDISKSREMDTLASQASPEMIASVASKHGCRSVAFTYNDPVIFHEYAIETAQACQQQGIRSVAVTAGYINEKPREEFFSHMDAANIDLKAFNENFYWKLTGAHLQHVLETLLYVKRETFTWLEITTLLIPGENDSEKEITEMCEWIFTELGADVPLHFSAFHPDWKMTNVMATPKKTLITARNIALKTGLKFVYTGNVHSHSGGCTWCPSCHHLLIERDWYQMGRWQLKDGCCTQCGENIPGIFEIAPGNWGAKRLPVQMPLDARPSINI